MNLFTRSSREKKTKEAHITLGELEAGTMPNVPLMVSDEDFQEVIARFPLVVIDCWAPWCMPCRILGPVIEELAEELQGKVAFGKLDVDDNISTAQDYGVMSIPTLLVFKNGELIDQMVGAVPKGVLKSQLEAYQDESDGGTQDV